MSENLFSASKLRYDIMRHLPFTVKRAKSLIIFMRISMVIIRVF